MSFPRSATSSQAANQRAGVVCVKAPVSSTPIKDVPPRPKRKFVSDKSIQEMLEMTLLSVSRILVSDTDMMLSDSSVDISRASAWVKITHTSTLPQHHHNHQVRGRVLLYRRSYIHRSGLEICGSGSQLEQHYKILCL
ncbi:hypothetical protein Pcinc_011457 [Petrolisthes cinctipes]|uniref:Uncharacterized protein n=1 Tax=Petrolisthes cinctipes TaxID=88211 RepID=A0AAE1G0W3_PETCI|nr:hypothetical protein Pcinc_011457 [Petrolisthes cinctipes]